MTPPASSSSRLSEQWRRLWFEPGSPDLFVALRITLGLLGIATVLSFMPVLMYWAVDGLAPIPGQGVGIRTRVLELGLSNVIAWLYFGTLLTLFACMTVGVATGWVTVFAFLGTSAITRWNHLPLSAAVHVLACVLFCLCWADCSGWPSVDAWRARRRGTHGPSSQPMWPIRLIRVQVCIIYLNAGLSKFLYPIWRDGATVHYAVSHNVFHRFPVHIAPSLDWIETMATYGTLAWEIGFPFMMFNRVTRRIALITGVLMHLGMGTTMEVGPFSPVMLGAYVAFLEPATVSRWFARLRTAAGETPLPATGSRIPAA